MKSYKKNEKPGSAFPLTEKKIKESVRSELRILKTTSDKIVPGFDYYFLDFESCISV